MSRGWKKFRRRWIRAGGGLENWTTFKDVTLVSSLSIMPYIFFWNFNQILQFFILTLKFYIDIESSILAVKVSHSNFVYGILIYMTTQHNVN